MLNSARAVLFRFIESFVERIGYHVTSNSFYQPIPDLRVLKAREKELWKRKPSNPVGLDFNEKAQLELLLRFELKYGVEYNQFPINWSRDLKPYSYYSNNGSFESGDGEILYCIIREFKPKQVIEIGSGNSTYLSAKAILKNQKEDKKYNCQLTVIDPYPNKVIKTGFPGLTKLIHRKVQDTPLEEFETLGQNDILFIDSSHVLAIGSDVQYEYLEILPRLKNGVFVHSHDVFLPAEYPRNWVLLDRIFWTEQYLLQAFLTLNKSFKVLWAGNFMHQEYQEKLKAAIKTYKNDPQWVGPGSFWIQRIKN